MFSIDQLYPHDLPIISHCLLVIPYWLHSFDILMFDGGPQTYHTKIVHIKLIINKLVHQHECALWMLLTCYFQKYLLTCYFQKYLLTIANIPYPICSCLFQKMFMCFSVSCSCQACALRLGHHLWTVATAAGARVTQRQWNIGICHKKMGFYWMLFSHD